jgi:parallel beta-helix repeat protein
MHDTYRSGATDRRFSIDASGTGRQASRLVRGLDRLRERMPRYRTALSIRSLLLLLVLLAPGSADAVTFYVRSVGNDANDGRSPGRAFATIGRAAGEARGGDSVIVGPGRYNEGEIKTAGNGRREEPLLLFADRKGEFTGDLPGDVIVDATGYLNAFRLTARPWIIMNGFSVTGATEEGIAVKSGSDSCVIANCIVFSNRREGIRIRDSADVVVFNNLIYANGGMGVEFEGQGIPERPEEGSPRGVVVNNTIYGNDLDGVRIEGVKPSVDMTVLNNVITENGGIGLNLKEQSAAGFVGQWNLNTNDYNTLSVARGRLDLNGAPLLMSPSGPDGILGGAGHADDNFRLPQRAAGQSVESIAVGAAAFKPKEVDLKSGTTRIDGFPDSGLVDLGFHVGNTSDFVSKLRRKRGGVVATVLRSGPRRLRKLRAEAGRCGDKAAVAREQRSEGKGACVQRQKLNRLVRQCGTAVEEVCR